MQRAQTRLPPGQQFIKQTTRPQTWDLHGFFIHLGFLISNMNPKEILSGISEMILADDEIAETLPNDVLDSGWLGFPPCSEEDIVRAEDRLGVSFPKSLREFYLLTNGWRNMSRSVYSILPIDKIDFLPNIDPELAEIIEQTSPDGSFFKMMLEFNSDVEMPKDETQELVNETITRPLRSIVLSTEGDATTTLIDPESDVGNGEWNVGAWASWHPGMSWSDKDFWSYLLDKLENY